LGKVVIDLQSIHIFCAEHSFEQGFGPTIAIAYEPETDSRYIVDLDKE